MQLRVEPFTFVVDEAFWRECAERKASDWRLRTSAVPIHAWYEPGRRTGRTAWPARLHFSLLDDHPDAEAATLHIHDTLPALEQATVTDPQWCQLHAFLDLKHWRFHFRAFYPKRPGHAMIITEEPQDMMELIDPCARDDAVGLPVWNALIGKGGTTRVRCQRQGFHTDFTVVVDSQIADSKEVDSKDVDGRCELSPVVVHEVVPSGEEAVRRASLLNLQLMTWRFAPGLDIAQLRALRVLVLGCGTLGCNVVRTLVGWGVERFTLVDNGTVGVATSLRQSLVCAADVGSPKVDAVARNLRKLFPPIQKHEPLQEEPIDKEDDLEPIDKEEKFDITPTIQMHNLTIPMPGQRQVAKDDILRLDALVRACDVAFLLTDNRESRWLPTLLCRRYDKACVVAALGFQDFVVNVNFSCGDSHNTVSPCTLGGCYFCGDPGSLPGQTQGTRPLDLTCTVSRPGMSMLASSVAVELYMQGTMLLNDHNDGDHTRGEDKHVRGDFDGSGVHVVDVANYRRHQECCACSEAIAACVFNQAPQSSEGPLSNQKQEYQSDVHNHEKHGADVQKSQLDVERMAQCLQDLPGVYSRAFPTPACSSVEHFE